MPNPGNSIDLDHLGEIMRARIEDLIHGVWHLQGHRDGNNFCCPNPLRGDRKAGSFVIALRGPYQGMVTDFAGEAIPGTGKQSASPLSFHIALMHGGSKEDGIAWAADWAGLSGRDPAALTRSKAAIQAFDQRPSDSPEEVEKKRKRAKSIYLRDTTPWAGSPVEAYYQGRGLDLRTLPFVPNGPKFKAKCFCGELGKPGNDPDAYVPAIILPFVAMDGTFLAVHRTYLQRDETGKWVKHRGISKAKKSYGAYAGGVIHLWSGTRVLPRTGEVVYGQPLSRAADPVRVHVTEGPEDGWAVALAYPDERVDVAGSLSNLGGLAYPDKVRELVLWRQADPAGSPAEKAFNKAVANLLAQGKRVMIADASSVMPGAKDAADVMQMGSKQ